MGLPLYRLAALAAAAGAAPTISASIRAMLPMANNTPATRGSTGWWSNRGTDYSAKTVTNPRFEWWNGWVNQAGQTGQAAEHAASTPLVIRASLLTGVTPPALDQSAATLTRLTFFGMLLDAAFVAAGGTVSGDGYTISIPGGFWATSDAAVGITLTAGAPFMVQLEEYVQSTDVLAYVTRARGSGDLGDAAAITTVSQPSLVTSKNWTGQSFASANIRFHQAVLGTGSAGDKSVLVFGTSILAPDGNDLTGDAKGARGYVRRALNAAGYSHFAMAVPGTTLNDIYLYGGDSARMRYAKYSSAVIFDCANDRTGNWNDAGGIYAKLKWIGQRFRTNGCKQVSVQVPPPHIKSAATFATLADQLTAGYSTAASDPATGWVNQTMIPWATRAGAYSGVAFDTAAGEPNSGWDTWSKLHAAAVAGGYTSQLGLWPVDGSTAHLMTPEGTHPTATAVGLLAAALQPDLPTLLGF